MIYAAQRTDGKALVRGRRSGLAPAADERYRATKNVQEKHPRFNVPLTEEYINVDELAQPLTQETVRAEPSASTRGNLKSTPRPPQTTIKKLLTQDPERHRDTVQRVAGRMLQSQVMLTNEEILAISPQMVGRYYWGRSPVEEVSGANPTATTGKVSGVWTEDLELDEEVQ